MATLHCHNCGWEQDDFWSTSRDGWEPFPEDRFRELMGKLHAAIDDPGKRMITGYDRDFFRERFGTLKEVDTREFVAYELERRARLIRGMVWMTEKDFMNESDKRCPKCGSRDLDID